jgi:N-acyl-D-aspartate/D-glutamate deacylase
MTDDPIIQGFMHPDRIYLLGDPPDYEPGHAASVSGIAAAAGTDPWNELLDLMLADGGRELLNSPVANYSHGNLDSVREMLLHPTSAFGLGDGGAHAGQTCDASTTTFLLTHWARDRAEGRLPVELAVHKTTQATATLYGLGDRGVLAPGYVGDVNIIDFDRLALHRPVKVADLPGGASRLIQRADGYVATVKGGTVTFAGGEHTGAEPGVLLRGAR